MSSLDGRRGGRAVPAATPAEAAPAPARLAPGPDGYPLVGILPLLRRDPLAFFVDTARRHGDVVRLDLGGETVLMLNDPRHVRHVLRDNQDNFIKSKYFDHVKLLFGNGIFTANGEVWLAHRRTAQPAFNGPRLSAMAATMVAAVDDMLARWRVEVGDGGRLDIDREMTELTLDIVLGTLFSSRFHAGLRELHGAMHRVLRDIERRIWSPFNPPLAWPVPRNLRLRADMRRIHAVVDGLIGERLQAEARRDDLLSMILDSEDAADPEGYESIRTQALGMVIAGHETTANALTWTWYLLARHPEAERRVRAEIDETLGGRAPGFEDLKRLPFTQAVFAESMRLFPPIWTISRAAVEADDIGGYRLPAGGVVMLCAYAIHRHPRFWEDPDDFRPERFVDDGGRRAAADYVYFPFGGGPRTCLGNRFAMMEAAIVLARTLQSWRLELTAGQEVAAQPMISLRPRDAIAMTTHLR